MPAPTLLSMATRACIRNLPGIADIAETPYDLIRPVLKKIINPQQLHDLEMASPHIADADAELWRAFIARDIPQWETKLVEPANPRSWWKVYRKLIREEQKAKEEQEAKLAEAMGGLSKQRDANRAQYVGTVISQGQKRQGAFVDGLPNRNLSGWGTVKATPALQNAKTGQHRLAALRRQSNMAAKERSLVKKNDFSRAMGPDGKSQIKAVPGWMVEQQKKPVPTAELIARTASPAVGSESGRGISQVFAPRKGPNATDQAINNALRAKKAADGEARLRALTGVKPKIAGSATPAPPPHSAPSARAPAKAGSSLKPSVRATETGVPRTNLEPAHDVASSPNPALALVRKRPASSPLMPAKRVKR